MTRTNGMEDTPAFNAVKNHKHCWHYKRQRVEVCCECGIHHIKDSAQDADHGKYLP